MNFEIEGKVTVIDSEQQISDKFKKREFVIEVENERNPDWNDFIKFQLTQDKCDLISDKKLGDKIKVFFNVRGRKWEKDGKVNYFSNLEAWRIEDVEEDVNNNSSASTDAFSDAASSFENEVGAALIDTSDDLPF